MGVPFKLVPGSRSVAVDMEMSCCNFPRFCLLSTHCHWVGLQADTYKNLLTGVLGSPVTLITMLPFLW